jgi:hypothetical protein
MSASRFVVQGAGVGATVIVLAATACTAPVGEAEEPVASPNAAATTEAFAGGSGAGSGSGSGILVVGDRAGSVSGFAEGSGSGFAQASGTGFAYARGSGS